MPKSFEEFYEEVEQARNLLVNASVWYAVKGGGTPSKELTKIIGDLIKWCEDNVPIPPEERKEVVDT
jgi:hypothetical protein